MSTQWPVDADGNPMAIVSGTASDKVPTVTYGSAQVGPVTISRPVPNGSIQDLIDAARETQRAAEYVVGVERRLLQWAIDPASKIASPVDASEAFAAPPAGYDASRAADPRDVAAPEAAAPAA